MEENKEKKEKTGFMAQARSVIIAIIAALSAIICVSIFTGGLVDYKKAAFLSTAIRPGMPTPSSRRMRNW